MEEKLIALLKNISMQLEVLECEILLKSAYDVGLYSKEDYKKYLVKQLNEREAE